jgi:hypothetical protein
MFENWSISSPRPYQPALYKISNERARSVPAKPSGSQIKVKVTSTGPQKKN